jgi:hypothetical protein
MPKIAVALTNEQSHGEKKKTMRLKLISQEINNFTNKYLGGWIVGFIKTNFSLFTLQNLNRTGWFRILIHKLEFDPDPCGSATLLSSFC